MPTDILNNLERELHQAAAEDAEQRRDTAAALREAVSRPLEVWEKRGPLKALAALSGLCLAALGLALVAGSVPTPPEYPYMGWLCLGAGAAVAALGVYGLTRRGPLLRLTAQSLESRAYEPIPWDKVIDYQVEDRMAHVVLSLSLTPGFRPRRREPAPLLIMLKYRTSGAFIVGECLRDYTWETVLERLDACLAASRLND